MFESFFKERNVGETSWILSEPWVGENQDAGKRFSFRVKKPQAFNESSNYSLCRLLVFHESDSKNPETVTQSYIRSMNQTGVVTILFATERNRFPGLWSRSLKELVGGFGVESESDSQQHWGSESDFLSDADSGFPVGSFFTSYS